MRLQWLLPAVSIALLAAVLYTSDLPKVVSVIAGADVRFVALGVGITLLNLLLRLVRWSAYLRNIDVRLTLRESAASYLPSLFLSNLTPGKVGDPARAYFLKRAKGVPMASGLASVVMERVMDVLALVVIGFLFFLGFGGKYVTLLQIGVLFTFIGLVIGVLKSRRLLGFGFSLLFRMMARARLRTGVDSGKIAEEVRAGMRMKWSVLLPTGMLTITIWVLEGLVFTLAFWAVGQPVSPLLVIPAFGIAVLAGVVSFLPGGVGSLEAVFALILGNFMDPGIAVSGILLGRFVSFWLAMFLTGLSWKLVK